MNSVVYAPTVLFYIRNNGTFIDFLPYMEITDLYKHHVHPLCFRIISFKGLIESKVKLLLILSTIYCIYSYTACVYIHS